MTREHRSTIVPGRRLPMVAALAHGGEYLDDSYENVSTESINEPVRNNPRRDSGRVAFMSSPLGHLNHDSDDDDCNAIPSKKHSVKIQKPKPSKTKNHSRRTSTSSVIVPRVFPARKRFPPARFWLGERPIYNWRLNGGGEFVRLSNVFSAGSLEKLKRDEASMRKRLTKKSRRKPKH